jgi:TRAP-type C4-dicarboxylate transport system permease small subunit
MPSLQPGHAPRAGAIERFRATYETALEWLVIVLMLVLAGEVMLGIVFRTLGRSLVWYDEMASILLAWLTFYGSALASVKRAHISCPELIEQLAPATKRALNVVAQVLVVAFFALLAWVGASILPVLATDHLVSLPDVPVSVVQSVIPISAVMMLVAELVQLWTLVRSRPVQSGGASLADGLH